MPKLILENCINNACPWSGKAVSEDSLTIYKDHIVGFCNTGCRDKFETALTTFDLAITEVEHKREELR